MTSTTWGYDDYEDWILSGEPVNDVVLELVIDEELQNEDFTLSENIGNLRNLESLALDGFRLTSWPEGISNLRNLEYLDLNWLQLTSLPESIGNLRNLKELTLMNNQLTSLPESIGNLRNLEYLSIYGNRLTSLPESIGNLRNLIQLNLMNNQLTSLPESIGNLQNLEYLLLARNRLTSLPESIGNLRNLQQLNLNNNPNLNELPRSIREQHPDLEIELEGTGLDTRTRPARSARPTVPITTTTIPARKPFNQFPLSNEGVEPTPEQTHNECPICSTEINNVNNCMTCINGHKTHYQCPSMEGSHQFEVKGCPVCRSPQVFRCRNTFSKFSGGKRRTRKASRKPRRKSVKKPKRKSNRKSQKVRKTRK